MIGYVTLGSNDLDKARGFYDALMPTIGAGRIMPVTPMAFARESGSTASTGSASLIMSPACPTIRRAEKPALPPPKRRLSAAPPDCCRVRRRL